MLIFDAKEDVAEDAVLKDARLTLTDGIMGLSWNMTDAATRWQKCSTSSIRNLQILNFSDLEILSEY